MHSRELHTVARELPEKSPVNGPRRLRLVGAGPRSEHALPELAPLGVSGPCWAVADASDFGAALQFAAQLAQALRAQGAAPFIAVCEFDAPPLLSSEQTRQLEACSEQLLTLRIGSAQDLAALVARAGAGSRIFVGEPAVLGLVGALKVVLDREGSPASLTPRARRLRAAAQLVLWSPRPALAGLLAQAWPLPTTGQ